LELKLSGILENIHFSPSFLKVAFISVRPSVRLPVRLSVR